MTDDNMNRHSGDGPAETAPGIPAEEFHAATDIVVRLDPEADLSPVVGFLTRLTGERSGKQVTVEVERADGLVSSPFGLARPTEEDLATLHALPGIESIRYIVVAREEPPEEGRETKIARRRAEMADDMLATLAKDCHPRLILDMTDPEMPPWTDCHAYLPNDGAQFKAALRVLDPPLRRAIKANDPAALGAAMKRTKATLESFAKAAKAGNFDRLSAIARSVHSAARQAA